MRFTAGEDFEFGLFAQAVDLVLGNQIVREDDLGLCSTLSCKGFDPTDSGPYPVLCMEMERRTTLTG